MPLLKDTEREQLRQLVKACLLEISKLKIELKKCQKESLRSRNSEGIQKRVLNDEFKKQLLEKENEIRNLKQMLSEKDDVIADLENTRKYFKALTAKPKKDITSFQSQIYQVLPYGENSAEDLYEHIKKVGFTELSKDNFVHALRNLERKGYFESIDLDGEISWKKIDK
jgi:archaellum component FlaC